MPTLASFARPAISESLAGAIFDTGWRPLAQVTRLGQPGISIDEYASQGTGNTGAAADTLSCLYCYSAGSLIPDNGIYRTEVDAYRPLTVVTKKCGINQLSFIGDNTN